MAAMADEREPAACSINGDHVSAVRNILQRKPENGDESMDVPIATSSSPSSSPSPSSPSLHLREASLDLRFRSRKRKNQLMWEEDHQHHFLSFACSDAWRPSGKLFGYGSDGDDRSVLLHQKTSDCILCIRSRHHQDGSELPYPDCNHERPAGCCMERDGAAQKQAANLHVQAMDRPQSRPHRTPLHIPSSAVGEQQGRMEAYSSKSCDRRGRSMEVCAGGRSFALGQGHGDALPKPALGQCHGDVLTCRCGSCWNNALKDPEEPRICDRRSLAYGGGSSKQNHTNDGFESGFTNSSSGCGYGYGYGHGGYEHFGDQTPGANHGFIVVDRRVHGSNIFGENVSQVLNSHWRDDDDDDSTEDDDGGVVDVDDGLQDGGKSKLALSIIHQHDSNQHHPHVGLLSSILTGIDGQAWALDSASRSLRHGQGSLLKPCIPSTTARSRISSIHGQNEAKLNRSIIDDGMFDMLSLHLPDERVHGGTRLKENITWRPYYSTLDIKHDNKQAH